MEKLQAGRALSDLKNVFEIQFAQYSCFGGGGSNFVTMHVYSPSPRENWGAYFETQELEMTHTFS